jgi:hypothetical protein
MVKDPPTGAKVDRLLLKTMAEEPPKAQYLPAKPHSFGNALRTTRQRWIDFSEGDGKGSR